MPDLSESPYSSYKSACRLVAITTFKHALGMDSYAFVAVDTTAVNETEVVIRIYNHFMHHLQRSLRAKENLNPWSVKKKTARLNTIYRRQRSVAAFAMKTPCGII